MTYEIKDPFAIASVYLWVGFVCAISFMESWLKFKAPGVDLPIGLGIGRLVFSTLNKVEWFFAIVIAFSFFISKNNLTTFSFLLKKGDVTKSSNFLNSSFENVRMISRSELFSIILNLKCQRSDVKRQTSDVNGQTSEVRRQRLLPTYC